MDVNLKGGWLHSTIADIWQPWRRADAPDEIVVSLFRLSSLIIYYSVEVLANVGVTSYVLL